MKKHWFLIVPGALMAAATPAGAIELREAVQAALNTNPEIRQAVSNKQATREERRQAEGLELIGGSFVPIDGVLEVADALLCPVDQRDVGRHAFLPGCRPSCSFELNLPLCGNGLKWPCEPAEARWRAG